MGSCTGPWCEVSAGTPFQLGPWCEAIMTLLCCGSGNGSGCGEHVRSTVLGRSTAWRTRMHWFFFVGTRVQLARSFSWVFGVLNATLPNLTTSPHPHPNPTRARVPSCLCGISFFRGPRRPSDRGLPLALMDTCRTSAWALADGQGETRVRTPLVFAAHGMFMRGRARVAHTAGREEPRRSQA